MNGYKKRKAAAREKAITWQHEFDEKCLSYGEIAYWQDYFTKQAKRYGLTQEFRENGII